MRDQPADGANRPCADAAWPAPNDVVAVAAEKQLILVPLDELDRLRLVADECVLPGAGRHVTEHVRIVAEQPIADAGRRDFALGVHDRLVVVLVDVAPPSLRVADEVHLGEFLEDGVEPLDAGVVVAVLEMHQHRHVVFLRQLGDALDVF